MSEGGILTDVDLGVIDDFAINEDDFFVILPGDIDFGPEDETEQAVASLDRPVSLELGFALGDWRGPVREFYQKLVEYARYAKEKIGDTYPELQMSVFFDRVDLAHRQRAFNHAVVKVRTNYLAGRSNYYPAGKERFCELHIERLRDGFTVRQVFFVGTGETKRTRAVKNLAEKISANLRGKIVEEVYCFAVGSQSATVANLESSDFLSNIAFYLKQFDERYFLAPKLRSKFVPLPAGDLAERGKKESEKTAVVGAAGEIAHGPEKKPWFKREESMKNAAGW
jgi:hypothetical protein